MSLAWPTLSPDSLDPATVEFKSPGLELLIDRLEVPGKHHVLDLGAPRRANVDFFSQLRCKLYIEDLERYLVAPPLPAPTAGEEAEAVDWDGLVAAALAHDRSSRLDVILAWDVLNYMPREAIQALTRRIAPCCRPGALLFMMVPTGETIPARPARVTLTPTRRLRYAPDTTEERRPNPRYTPLALERMMPGFGLLHSFLLGDGMQDYLFSYR